MGRYILEIKKKVYEILYKLFCIFHKPPHVMSTDATINKIVKEQYSISRYGDGEFSLILGESLPFQRYDEELAQRLKEILNSRSSRHLVAIPNVFGSLDDFSEKSQQWWKEYLLGHRKQIYHLLDMNKTYYDAQMTRIYINRKNRQYSRQRFEMLKKLWEGKNILIIEGVLSRFGAGNDLFDRCESVKRILVPAKNAFGRYNEIMGCALQACETCKIDLILLAIGPTATCLAYDLSQYNIQTVDIGNLDMEYEWMNLGAQEQVAIQGKYTHEAKNGHIDVAAFDDKKYKNQIILEIY